MAVVCRGICQSHDDFNVTRGYNSKDGRMEPNFYSPTKDKKRCQTCSKYLETKVIRCPCCNTMLRTRGRNNRSRRKRVNSYPRIE